MPKIMTLEMEKMCHTEEKSKDDTLTNLTQCLKDHVEPADGIISATEEVEESFEKTRLEKVLIWIRIFLSVFLIPLSVMVSDMSLDNILVFGSMGYVRYLTIENDTLPSPNVTDLCYETLNSTKQQFSKLLQLYEMAPGGLTGKPIFWYSLSFIVFPWCFYFIEFLHSRHRKKAANKVANIVKIFLQLA